MLVLTRRQNEGIIITTPSGEEIYIRVIKARKNDAQIGILASTNYIIAREELLQQDT